jgi:hypothetical protein
MVAALKPGGIIMLEDPIEWFALSSDKAQGPPQVIKDFALAYRGFASTHGIEAVPGPRMGSALMESRQMSELHSKLVPAPLGSWTHGSWVLDIL